MLRQCHSVLISVIMITTAACGNGRGDSHSKKQLESSKNQIRAVVISDDSVNLDSKRVQQLLQTVEQQTPIPGLPPEAFEGGPITIRLTRNMEATVHGSALSADRLVNLPVSEVFEWPATQRARVVRHELAHIALGTFFDSAPLPRWFNEGFAEWASGGLDCVAEARVRLDIVTRKRQKEGPPTFESLSEDRLRLDYDLFGTIFIYLE